MSFRDLPKSLIDSVVEITTESQHTHQKQTNRLIEQGLKRFGAKAINDLSENDQKALHAWVQIQLTESSCGCDSDIAEDDMPGDSVYHKDGDEEAEKKKELDEEDEDLKESIALGADEIATNGAVGVTDPDNQYPVHADVLKDTSVDGKHEYRLFVQFNTNNLPTIVPPVTLPGSPTVDALRDVVEGLPFFCDVCEKALVSASDVPHERPEHKGASVSEAYVPTIYDKKVVQLMKSTLKLKKSVDVEDYISSGVHVKSFTAKINDLYVTAHERPSKNQPGKSEWYIHQELGTYPIDPISSLPFPAGDVVKGLSALKSALNKVDLAATTEIDGE